MLNTHRGPGWAPTLIPLFVLFYFVYYLKKLKFKSKKDILEFTIFYIIAVILIDLTQAPVAYSKEAFDHIHSSHQFRYNVIPFASASQKQFYLNIILFIPLGMALTYFRKNIKWHHVISIGLLSSLLIELTQLLTSVLYINVRSFDVDDILTNTLGALIGYIIIKLYRLCIKKTDTMGIY